MLGVSLLGSVLKRMIAGIALSMKKTVLSKNGSNLSSTFSFT